LTGELHCLDLFVGLDNPEVLTLGRQTAEFRAPGHQQPFVFVSISFFHNDLPSIPDCIKHGACQIFAPLF